MSKKTIVKFTGNGSDLNDANLNKNLINFEEIESREMELKGENLQESQDALAYKINQLIEAYNLSENISIEAGNGVSITEDKNDKNKKVIAFSPELMYMIDSLDGHKVKTKDIIIQREANETKGEKVHIATKKWIKKEVGEKIINAHHDIVGTAFVLDKFDAAGKMKAFNSGQSFVITGKDGKDLNYSKATAKQGDIVVIALDRKLNPLGDFKTEEAIILSDKNAELLTHENEHSEKLKSLDETTKEHETKLNNAKQEEERLEKEKLPTDGSVGMNPGYSSNVNKPESVVVRKDLDSSISDLINRILDGSTSTVKELMLEIKDLLSRTSSLEKLSASTTNFWMGEKILAGTNEKNREENFKDFEGDDGKYNFSLRNQFTVTVKNLDSGDVDTEQIAVSRSGTTEHSNDFSLKSGQDDIQISIDEDGLVKMHRIKGTIHLSRVAITRLMQETNVKDNSYYETKENSSKEKTRVNKALSGKQSKNDDKLTSAGFASSSVVDSIIKLFNEVKKVKNEKQSKSDDSLKAAGLKTKELVKSILENFLSIKENKTSIDKIKKVKVDDVDKDLYDMNGSSEEHTLVSLHKVKELVSAKSENGSVKDLTHIKNKLDLFNATTNINNEEWYMIKFEEQTEKREVTGLFQMTHWDPGNSHIKEFKGFVGNKPYVFYCDKNYPTQTLEGGVANPTNESEVATKKYVDDKISKTITLTFDDGSTEDIKVG